MKIQQKDTISVFCLLMPLTSSTFSCYLHYTCMLEKRRIALIIKFMHIHYYTCVCVCVRTFLLSLTSETLPNIYEIEVKNKTHSHTNAETTKQHREMYHWRGWLKAQYHFLYIFTFSWCSFHIFFIFVLFVCVFLSLFWIYTFCFLNEIKIQYLSVCVCIGVGE